MLNLKPRKNNPYIPTEYKQFYFLRTFSFVVILIAIISVITGLYLIYQNIYMAIAQTQNSLLFNPNLSQEIIDFDNYDKIKQNWDEKNSTTLPQITRDPFNEINTSTPKNIDKKA